MQIKSVFDDGFRRFGKVITGYDFSGLLKTLEENTEKPDDGVVYVPGLAVLEQQPAAAQIRDNIYGGMPIQIGYCNGTNNKLNCLEYHRDTELNIMADDIVFLVAELKDVRGGTLDTAKVEAFEAPKGSAVQLYETTLHYAPARTSGSFRVVVVLPKGTNTEKPDITPVYDEDKLLWARNKWLMAHPDSVEAKNGAFVGLVGRNIAI